MTLRDEHYFAFAFVATYLEFYDVAQLFATASRFKFLEESVHQLVFDNRVKRTCLKRTSKFTNLADLTILYPGSLAMNLNLFMKLTALSVVMYQCGRLTSCDHQQWTVHEGIRYLKLRKWFCPTVKMVSSFLEQFRGLTILELDHCMPLLLRQFSCTLAIFTLLESLTVTNCLSDRGPLHLDCLRKLQRLRIASCSNLTGLLLSNSTKLLSISITNCPISVTTVAHILHVSPHLHELVVSRCGCVRGRVELEHAALQSLSLEGCANISELRLICPKVAKLVLEQCRSLILLSVCSHRLRSLDLQLLSVLEHVQLQCAHLRTLNLVGCTTIGTKRYRARYNEDNDTAEQNPAHVGPLSSALDLLGLDNSTDPADESDRSSGTASDYDSDYSASLPSGTTRHTRRFSGPSPVCSPGKVGEPESLPAVYLMEQLLVDCPELDWTDFLHTRIGGSGLHEHREELTRVITDYGVQMDKRGGTTPPNSPPRRKLAMSKVTPKLRKPRRAAKKN